MKHTVIVNLMIDIDDIEAFEADWDRAESAVQDVFNSQDYTTDIPEVIVEEVIDENF